MTTDAYSPLTGRWGVEGVWDVGAGALMLALLGALVVVLGTSRWHRLVGSGAVLMLLPGSLGFVTLGDVQVNKNGEPVDCLLRGPVDGGTDCGAAYLDRYLVTAVPLALAVVAMAWILFIVARTRVTRRPATG